jgi:hypothetical protein
MATLQRIKQKIIDRSYYISSHAEDEMLDDRLERLDVENAILKGKIEKKLQETKEEQDTGLKDPRRTEERFTLSAGSRKTAISS